MRVWLARFSYSLLIIGGFLLYQVYKFQTSEEKLPAWQTIMIGIGGMLAIFLGSQGIRERHRRLREQNFDRDEQ